jgi:hypothetical protein
VDFAQFPLTVSDIIDQSAPKARNATAWGNAPGSRSLKIIEAL